MKKLASIKTRITIWYTSLVFVIIAVVLTVVGVLSYRLSIDNIEKDVTLRVTRVAEKISDRSKDVFYKLDNDEEFKNVSIYEPDGSHIAGEYIYDIANLEFKEGAPRIETVDGKDYIVYDVYKSMRFISPDGVRDNIPDNIPPGVPGGGFWIRGVESVNSTTLLGKSAFMVILFMIPFILIIVDLSGYYITRKAFLPINNIVKTADKICMEKDVKQRIDINKDSPKDELYNLSVTLNTMLDKIETLIMQEKQFTSDASHELRTPISVILAQGEYLLDIAKNEKERELAANIVEKAKQISKLVSSLLLIARIDSNRQKINMEKVNVSAVVDIAADGFCELIEQKNITITKDIDESIMVNGDETLLISSVSNIISNAVKYGRNDGNIKISAFRNCGLTEITIADDGIGITPENLEKIWERFYRVDDVRNDEYGSSGLGLSMVKAIIELHGGTIDVVSEYGKGTEFVIKLNC